MSGKQAKKLRRQTERKAQETVRSVQGQRESIKRLMDESRALVSTLLNAESARECWNRLKSKPELEGITFEEFAARFDIDLNSEPGQPTAQIKPVELVENVCRENASGPVAMPKQHPQTGPTTLLGKANPPATP